MTALNFEAVKVALKQDKNGFILTLAIHPDEAPEELLRDFVGARYGVAMVRIGDDEKPYVREDKTHPDVVRAGILCRDQRFQKYMYQWHMAEVVSEECCAEKLCDLLGIRSRTELATSESARQAFTAILNGWAASLVREEKHVPF